jgi:hypothetical protein|tara:strand:+ start:1847 stop:2482 length:636 start_codon:yes stop_codon:yes gene_type:complete
MDKKYFETRKGSLEDKINTIAAEQPSISKPETDVKLSVEKKYFETKKGSLEDLASKLVESKLDPVNKDAVKKKFDDRKDKDIDNDGDVDSSDKFLHKRRKAISKATSEEVEPCGLPADECWDSHKQVGYKMKGGKRVPNCVPKSEAVTQDDKGEKQNADKHKAYADPKKGEKKPFSTLRKETKLIRLGDNGKTATGQKAAVIDVEPSAKPI